MKNDIGWLSLVNIDLTINCNGELYKAHKNDIKQEIRYLYGENCPFKDKNYMYFLTENNQKVIHFFIADVIIHIVTDSEVSYEKSSQGDQCQTPSSAFLLNVDAV